MRAADISVSSQRGRYSVSSPPTTRSPTSSVHTATTSPPVNIKPQGRVRLRHGPTSAGCRCGLNSAPVSPSANHLGQPWINNLMVPDGSPKRVVRVDCLIEQPGKRDMDSTKKAEEVGSCGHGCQDVVGVVASLSEQVRHGYLRHTTHRGGPRPAASCGWPVATNEWAQRFWSATT